jgi:hypothetical protein
MILQMGIGKKGVVWIYSGIVDTLGSLFGYVEFSFFAAYVV